MTSHTPAMPLEPAAPLPGPPPGLPPGPLVRVYEDAQLLAVNKPAGLLVHRTALDAADHDDVVTRLRAQTGAPVWPLHRLDKGPSGVLLLARDVASARRLGAVFAAGAAGEAGEAGKAGEAGPGIDKRYLALVRGWPAEAGEIDQPLARDPELPSAGQPRLAAVTRWQVLQRLLLPLATGGRHADTRLALVAVQPLSGRRHQIRRHFKALAHPLIGDATHGKGPLNRAIAAFVGYQRLWLHALELTVPHPATGQPLHLRAEPGPEWQRWAVWAEPAALTGLDDPPGADQPKRNE